jgi:O-antigen ligase/Flp pilus assembly protein TadD
MKRPDSGGQSTAFHPCTALLAAGVFLAFVAHVPSVWPTLNAFDPWKRVAWCLLIAVAAWLPSRRHDSVPDIARWIWLALVAWVIARSALRPNAFAELDVTATWLLPIAALAAGWRLRDDAIGRPIAIALVAFAALQSLLMLLQFAGLDPLFGETTAHMDYRPARMIGTIGYQNQAADVIAIASGGLFLAIRSTPLRMLAFVLFLGVIAMTGNRGALVAAVIATGGGHIALGMQDRSLRRRSCFAACALAGTALVIIALVPTTRERFADVVRNGAESPAIETRLPMWGIAAELWSDNPIIGHGGGTFALEYVERLAQRLPEEKDHVHIRNLVHAREAHMDFIQFGAEFGAIGVALAGALFFFLFRKFTQNATERPDGQQALACAVHTLAYMAGASCVSFPVQSAVAGPLAAFSLALWSPSRAISQGKSIRMYATVSLRGLSAALLLWSLTDARLTFAIPHRLSMGRTGEAVAIIPPWGHKYLALAGAAYAAEGKMAEAEATLTASRDGYLDVNLLSNLGHVYAARSNWVGAIAAYDLWSRSGINHRSALDNLSISYEQNGEFSISAKWLAHRMALWPQSSVKDAARLAHLYYSAGEYQLALNEIHRLLKRTQWRRNRLPAELNNLAGACLLRLGYPREAHGWFVVALEVNPHLESARRNVEMIRLAVE